MPTKFQPAAGYRLVISFGLDKVTRASLRMGLKDDYLENHLMNANLCAFQTMEKMEARLTDAMPFNGIP